MPERGLQLLITCEHGGNHIPRPYQSVFRGARDILKSHRGYDPGSLALAKLLARRLRAPLEFETRSRLLIELNRTLGHPRIFSEFSRQLPQEVQQALIEEIYLPYRLRVREHLQRMTKKTPVLHLSIHSFTPVLNEKTRRTDIGLLFDPARTLESAIAHRWRKALKHELPDMAVHFNLPYRGTSDGFTTTLRKEFADSAYAGIELEVNQKFPLSPAPVWDMLMKKLVLSVRGALTV